MSETLDVTSQATSHLKQITDAIKKYTNSMTGPPPADLVNDPNDPDYDPTKPASWWSPEGSTPEFYKGNYIPMAATNCSQVQCAPDGFAMA